MSAEDPKGSSPRNSEQPQQPDEPKEANAALPTPSKRARRALLGVIGALLLLAATVLVLSWFFGHRAEAKDRHEREAVARKGPKLSVVQVEASARDRQLTLPGDVRGYEQITLYAKIAGYLRSIDVERGDHVAAGQVLGVIESPENDQDVISARSDAVVKHLNADRARSLVAPGIVSEMDKDLAENDERQSKATLERVTDVKSYEKVRAPYAGVVTARYVDPGALMPAATGATVSAQPLVDVAQVDRLRVFVYLGQDAAPFVGAGDSVVLWQDELPEKQIHAAITRCAAALDQRTRRMQCEVVIDNRAWGLLPGTSVHVRLQIHAGTAAYVPNEALVIRDGKTWVATVRDRRIHLLEVELGATDGKNVRILRGLSAGDTIALNLPVELEENSPVQPVAGAQTSLASSPGSAASTRPTDDAEREATSQERSLGVARDDQTKNDSEVSTPKPAASGR